MHHFVRYAAWVAFVCAAANTVIRVLDYSSENPVLPDQTPGPVVVFAMISGCWWFWYECKDYKRCTKTPDP